MERIGKLYFEFSHGLFDSKFSIKNLIEILSKTDSISFFDKNKVRCNEYKKVFYFSVKNKKEVIKTLTKHF